MFSYLFSSNLMYRLNILMWFDSVVLFLFFHFFSLSGICCSTSERRKSAGRLTSWRKWRVALQIEHPSWSSFLRNGASPWEWHLLNRLALNCASRLLDQSRRPSAIFWFVILFLFNLNYFLVWKNFVFQLSLVFLVIETFCFFSMFSHFIFQDGVLSASFGRMHPFFLSRTGRLSNGFFPEMELSYQIELDSELKPSGSLSADWGRFNAPGGVQNFQPVAVFFLSIENFVR